MAQDFVLLNGRSEIGRIAIEKSVLESIALQTVTETENAVAIPENTFSKPVVVRIEDNTLELVVNIKVAYGANVNATCEVLQNKVYENINYMTGLKCNDVSVNVMGFEI